jgi:acetyltransferase-like isoleucine patch superfamily enzyme
MRRAAAPETRPLGKRRAKHLPASPPSVVEITGGAGAPFNEADAAAINSEVAALVAKNGWSSFDEIWAFAKAHPHSALHRNIEWDKEIGAKKYQIIQVANICRYLKYSVEQSGHVYLEKIWEHVRVTKSSGHPAGPGYVVLPRVEVLNNAELRGDLERRALRELKAWQDRYEKIQRISSPEFRFIYEAIRKFEAMVLQPKEKRGSQPISP